MYLLVRDGTINGETKKIVFGIYDESSTNVTSALLLRSRELFNHYSARIYLKIAVLDGSVPVLTTTATQSLIACSGIYNTVKKHMRPDGGLDDKVAQAIAAQLENVLSSRNIARDTAGKLANTIVQFSASDLSTNGKLTLAQLDNFSVEQLDPATSRTILDEYMSRDAARGTDTIFQHTCTDKLYLRLPTNSQLASDDFELEDLIPKREEVCIPYQNKAAYTSAYKQPGSGVPQSMYPLIEGNAQNNELPIQENEREFYEKLVQWIRGNIASELGPEALNADDKNVVLDSTTEQFFNTMYAIIYSWHWGHNPNVPMYDPEDDNDEFSENADTGGSKYVYNVMPGEEYDLYVPAFVPLQHFVQQAAMELGYKIFAEAVIKLCRWGTRKPTALFFDGYPFIFDLGKGLTEAYAGKISDYTQCVDENDCNMILKGVIMCNSRIIDTKYMLDAGYTYNSFPVPVGLTFAQVYVNRKNPEKKLQLEFYYSMVDVVNLLFSGKDGTDVSFRPKGFSIKDGKILAPEMVARKDTIGALSEKYANEKATSIANPFYCSPALQDLFIELNASNMARELNQFSIIDNGVQTAELAESFEDNSFSTLNELAEKFADCIIPSQESAISSNVFRILLPILLDVNNCFAGKSDYSLSDILNSYKDAMVRNGYVDEAAFYSGRKQNVKPFSERHGFSPAMTAGDPVDNNGQEQTNVSTKKQEERQTEVVQESNAATTKPYYSGNPLVSEVGETPVVTSVYWQEKKNRIGYCTLRKILVDGKPSTEIVLLGKDYPERYSGTEVKRCANFAQLIAYLLNDLLSLSKGENSFRVKAESEKCLKYYVDLYATLIKKES